MSMRERRAGQTCAVFKIQSISNETKGIAKNTMGRAMLPALHRFVEGMEGWVGRWVAELGETEYGVVRLGIKKFRPIGVR